jgi:hypothetical protein
MALSWHHHTAMAQWHCHGCNAMALQRHHCTAITLWNDQSTVALPWLFGTMALPRQRPKGSKIAPLDGPDVFQRAHQQKHKQFDAHRDASRLANGPQSNFQKRWTLAIRCLSRFLVPLSYQLCPIGNYESNPRTMKVQQRKKDTHEQILKRGHEER